MKHIFSFAGFTMKEGRLVYFAGGAERPRQPDQLNEGGNVAPNQPGKNPGAASRERMKGAQSTTKEYNERFVKTIVMEFKILTQAGGKTATDAKGALDTKYPDYELVLNADKLVRVNVKNPNAPEKPMVKDRAEFEQKANLEDGQKTAINAALNYLNEHGFGKMAHQCQEFLLANGDEDISKKRIEAFTAMCDGDLDMAFQQPVGSYSSCLEAIGAGDIKVITEAAGTNPEIQKVLAFINGSEENRAVASFIGTISIDMVKPQRSRPSQAIDAKEMADAQAMLDAIAANPDLSKEDAAMQKGAVMMQFGIGIKEGGGKLTAVPPNPDSKWENITNRLAGVIAWVTALGAKLKGIGNEFKSKVDAALPPNPNAPGAAPNGPAGSAEAGKGTADDPVNPEIREDLKTTKYNDLKADLNTGGATFDKAKDERDIALGLRDAADTAAKNARTAFADAERAYNEDTSDPKDPAKKTAMDTAKTDLDAKELDLKQKEELLKPKEDAFQKVLDRQKKLNESKKRFDDMFVDLGKDVAKATDTLRKPNMERVKDADEFDTLITDLNIHTDPDTLTIKVDIADLLDDSTDPTKPTIKSMLKKNGMDVSVCEHDGDTVKKPRALAKAMKDLAEKLKADKTTPDAIKERFSEKAFKDAGVADADAEAAGKINGDKPIINFKADGTPEIINLDELAEDKLAVLIAGKFAENKDMQSGKVRDALADKLNIALNDWGSLEGKMVLKTLLNKMNAPASVEINVSELNDKAGMRLFDASKEAGKIGEFDVVNIEGSATAGLLGADDVDKWIIDNTDGWTAGSKFADRKTT